jgi:hypothetical protein
MSATDFFDEDLGQRRSAIRATTMGQGTDIVAPKHDEVPVRPLSDLNLTRMARHREEVNAQVATARVEIEKLRRKQTDLEREKQSLEDMSQKQDLYEQGRQEMIDRFTESLVSLEKLESHASRQMEIYSATRQRFGALLGELQGLSDTGWTDETFREELGKAVALIDNIRKEFVKLQAAVEAAGGPPKLFDELRAAPVADRVDITEEDRGFSYWLKIGLAVSLPVVVALVVAVIVIIAALAR